MTMPAVMLAVLIGATTPATAVDPPATVPPEHSDPASTAVALREADTRMTVAVTIDGAGPFRFVVDSGATRTVISGRLAALLGLPSAGAVDLHSVGGESAVPSVRVAALTLGGLPARPIVAPVLEEADLGAAGILGIDALTDKKVVIDMDRGRMAIEPADRHTRDPAPGEIVVVARRRYGQLVLADADAAGERIWAIVDTGSMVTIGNGELQRRLVHSRRAILQPLTITDVTGRAIPSVYARVGDVRLGTWHLRGVPIAFVDAHAFDRFGLSTKPSMLLGMDLLRAFSRVSIDFRRRTVRLLKRGETR